MIVFFSSKRFSFSRIHSLSTPTVAHHLPLSTSPFCPPRKPVQYAPPPRHCIGGDLPRPLQAIRLFFDNRRENFSQFNTLRDSLRPPPYQRQYFVSLFGLLPEGPIDRLLVAFIFTLPGPARQDCSLRTQFRPSIPLIGHSEISRPSILDSFS